MGIVMVATGTQGIIAAEVQQSIYPSTSTTAISSATSAIVTYLVMLLSTVSG
jgi:hypothetical protein